MTTPLPRWAIAALLLGALALSSCKTAYYGALEKMGVHKRDILVERVEDGRDAQHAAKEQFQSALEAFREVSDFEGGELEQVYERLQKEYDRSEARVAAVRDRIDAIEDVAEDLFDEWKRELEQIQDDELRRRDELNLRETRNRYEDLIGAMRRAERKMAPVLTAFSDHVVFLKHNLNVQAIASLQGQLVSIEDGIAQLIVEMEESIGEADAFIASMDGSEVRP